MRAERIPAANRKSERSLTGMEGVETLQLVATKPTRRQTGGRQSVLNRYWDDGIRPRPELGLKISLTAKSNPNRSGNRFIETSACRRLAGISAPAGWIIRSSSVPLRTTTDCPVDLNALAVSAGEDPRPRFALQGDRAKARNMTRYNARQKPLNVHLWEVTKRASVCRLRSAEQ